MTVKNVGYTGWAKKWHSF